MATRAHHGDGPAPPGAGAGVDAPPPEEVHFLPPGREGPRADVLLRVGRAEFHCHGQVLSLWSKVLGTSISIHEPAKNGEPIVITLEEDAGLTPATMGAFLGLMYPHEGEEDGPPVLADALFLPVMRLADRYDAPGVAMRCSDWLHAPGQSKVYSAVLKDAVIKCCVTHIGEYRLVESGVERNIFSCEDMEALEGVLGSDSAIYCRFTKHGIKRLLALIFECGSIASRLRATRLADACKSFIATIFPQVVKVIKLTPDEIAEMLALPEMHVWASDITVTMLKTLSMK